MKEPITYSSDNYAKFRPTYPQTIFDFLYPLIKDKHKAWDCAAANGLLAQELSLEFETVEATDIKKSKIDNAYQADNIHYSIQSAEKTNFKDDTFDLITVAQAIHWFDIDAFNEEVKRVGKPNSIIALIGYEINNISITPEIDQIIALFYKEILGSYWGNKRQLLEQRYQTVPFPFRELETPEISNIKLWKYDHLIGYLNSWSAVKNFIKTNGYNPIEDISQDLENAWGDSQVRKINFPIIFRAGRVK